MDTTMLNERVTANTLAASESLVVQVRNLN